MKQEQLGLYILDVNCLSVQTDKTCRANITIQLHQASYIVELCKKLCKTKRCPCRQHGLFCSNVGTKNAEIKF